MTKALELAAQLKERYGGTVPTSQAAALLIEQDAEIKRRRALNAELVDALILCYEHCRLWHPEVQINNVGTSVREVLDKAKEEA